MVKKNIHNKFYNFFKNCSFYKHIHLGSAKLWRKVVYHFFGLNQFFAEAFDNENFKKNNINQIKRQVSFQVGIDKLGHIGFN